MYFWCFVYSWPAYKKQKSKIVSKHKYNFENFTQKMMISTILLHFRNKKKILQPYPYHSFEGKSTRWLTSHNHTSINMIFNLIYYRYLVSIQQMLKSKSLWKTIVILNRQTGSSSIITTTYLPQLPQLLNISYDQS